MAKFKQDSLKLKDNQRVYFGTNDEGSLYFDGTDLQITSAGININITPGGSGKVVLDGMNFPIADGSDGDALTTDGAGQMSWNTLSG